MRRKATEQRRSENTWGLVFSHVDAHINAVCVTINHKPATVDVPTIEGPPFDSTNVG
jgi:hypothetical protein